MAYQTLLFDLDGTIIDSAPGIYRSVQYALSKFGIMVSDPQTLRPFIGPPLMDSFMQYYHMSEEDARLAVKYYRELYEPEAKLECTVYTGIPKLLETLHAAGRRVVLATSKPEVFARAILEHFSLDRYFDRIGGALLGGGRDTKEEVLRYILSEVSAENAVMIGDTKFDMAGAKALGLPAIGVTYGFGSREELISGGAAALAESPEELGKILMEGERAE